MDIKETALQYLSAGLSVMPVRIAKSKRPDIPWKEFQYRLPSPDEINEFFTDGVDGVGLICGAVSGNLEVMDFDNKNGDIETVIKEWSLIPGVKDIVSGCGLIYEKSMNGGYHVAYRSPKIENNLKLASGKAGVMIETRGEGGFIVCSPTPGYKLLKGDISKIPIITAEKRDLLISAAMSLTQEVVENPDSKYKLEKSDVDMEGLLTEAGWKQSHKSGTTTYWSRPGKTTPGWSATLREGPRGGQVFYCFSTSIEGLEPGKGYGALGLYAALKCDGDMGTAKTKLKISEPVPEGLIRVGDNYFKFVEIPSSRDDHMIRYWTSRSRQTILDDMGGKEALKRIPKYEAFFNYPNHKDYRQVINGCFNLYHRFPHEGKPGDWPVTRRLLEQVFGEQIEIGIDYIHLLYHNPAQILPVLCLVSPENSTGKTTLLNWLNYLFSDNMIIIGYNDIMSDFNRSYASRLIIASEESLVEDPKALNKIKAMATQKKIMVNEKWVSPVSVDFYGKIILTSNYDDSFVSASQWETRFWVRRLKPIPKEQMDPEMERKLQAEAPAFVYYLQNRAMTHKKMSRMWFTAEDLETDQLRRVRMQSRSMVFKELLEKLSEYFYKNNGISTIRTTPGELKDVFFNSNNQISSTFIRRCLNKEMQKKTEKFQRFMSLSGNERPGTPFYITKKEIMILLNGEDDEEVLGEGEVIKEAPIRDINPTDDDFPISINAADI